MRRTITFNAADHTYRDEDNNNYLPVSNLIEEVCPKFNREFWSKYKADQANISQREVLKNWDDITKEAIDRGNSIHKSLEDSVNQAKGTQLTEENILYGEKSKLLSTALNPLGGREFTNVNLDVLACSELAKKYPEIFEFLRAKINTGYKLYVEKRVYSYEYLVAGTIDLLLVLGKSFIIVDWKTNKKELLFKSGYYKKVGGIESTQWIDTNDMMLEPLGYIQHCKGNRYRLQLNLYAFLTELHGLTCTGLVLFHIRPDMRPKQYNIEIDRPACRILLNHRKDKLEGRIIDIKSDKTNNNSKFGIT